MEDIAVVGLACRFPGDATSPERLWELLSRGDSAWTEFPKDRFNIDGFYHPDSKRQGSISFRGAHLLKDDIAAWDASFFGMHDEDAMATDPQHRILLEVSYEAIENAGLRKEDLSGSKSCVWIGTFVKDYEQTTLRDPNDLPKYAATGTANAILANRLSWFYNFRGTSQAIDTACSGSLVAVHHAARCLQTHDANIAMVGGAGMILAADTMMPMDSMNFLSKDGKCFTFDHRANGYGRGEGFGVVILKRISDAIQDGDTIRAVIRGTMTNHDGHTAGIALPNGEAQADNIREVYERAGLSFTQTGYIECHGTGTQAGDRTELRAISETLSKDRTPENPVVVGSVKTNIGHLEGAAGVAGLIKAILCLEKGRIPQTINYEKPNPEIDFEGWKVKVPRKMMNWPVPGPRRASVNSFGFGGTNAHAIVDEASAYLEEKGLKGNHNSAGYDYEPIPTPLDEDEAFKLASSSSPSQSEKSHSRSSSMEDVSPTDTVPTEIFPSSASANGSPLTKPIDLVIPEEVPLPDDDEEALFDTAESSIGTEEVEISDQSTCTSVEQAALEARADLFATPEQPQANEPSLDGHPSSLDGSILEPSSPSLSNPPPTAPSSVPSYAASETQGLNTPLLEDFSAAGEHTTKETIADLPMRTTAVGLRTPASILRHESFQSGSPISSRRGGFISPSSPRPDDDVAQGISLDDVEDNQRVGPWHPTLHPIITNQGGVKKDESAIVTRKQDDAELLATGGFNLEDGVETGEHRKQIFIFSSAEKLGVARMIDSHIDFLKSQPSLPNIADYLYSLGCRRSSLEWRSYIIADSMQGLIDKRRTEQPIPLMRAPTKSKKICFVFGGQGAVWAEMGQGLMCYPVFNESMKAASDFMKNNLGSPFDLLDEFAKSKGDSRISSPDIAQPSTTALQVALVDLFASFGVSPASVVGHSSGEVAAAYAAKAITREQAWSVAYWRGYHAIRVIEKDPNAMGRMLVVAMSAQDAEEYIKTTGRPVEIACNNSPTLVTLSGHKDDIEFISDDLKKRADKLFFRVMDIPVAYHSRHMALINEDYTTSVGKTAPTIVEGSAKMYSSVSGKLLDKSTLVTEYWAKNMTDQVKFLQALRSLAEEETPDLFIEVSPSNAMKSSVLSSVEDSYGKTKPEYLSVLNAKATGTEWTLTTVGECWIRGVPVKFDKLIPRTETDVLSGPYRHLVTLPSYPWNHDRRYWRESHLGLDYRNRSAGRKDLVGARTLDSTPFTANYRQFLRISENPWMQDHQVQKTILYPASGMMTMMIEGVSMELGHRREKLAGFQLEDFSIYRALIVPGNDHGMEVQLSIRLDNSQSDLTFLAEIYSKPLGGPWVHNCRAVVRPRLEDEDWKTWLADYEGHFKKAQRKCDHAVKPRQLYEAIDVVGMNYGPLFQNIESILTPHNQDDHSVCISTIKVPDTKKHMPMKHEYEHFIHPATLDSMFQTLFAIESDPMVPKGIDKVWISGDLKGKAGTKFSGYSAGHRDADNRGAMATVVMNAEGRSWEAPSVVLEGAHFTKVTLPSAQEGGFIPNHRNLTSQIVWKKDVVLSRHSCDLSEFLALFQHKFPESSILQMGIDKSTTIQIVDLLTKQEYDRPPRFTRFSISEDSEEGTIFPALEKEYGNDTPIMKYIEQREFDTEATGPKYNLILLGDNKGVELDEVRKSLRPDGFILDFISQPDDEACQQGRDEHVPALDSVCSETLSFACGGHGNPSNIRVHRRTDIEEYKTHPEITLLVPDEPSEVFQAVISSIEEQFASRNVKVNTITWDMLCEKPKDCDELVSARPCISLVDAGDAASDSPYQWNETDFTVFKAVVKTAKGLLWVTVMGDDEYNGNDQFHAMFTGLSRTIRSEDVTKTIIHLNLDGPRAKGQYDNFEERVYNLVLSVYKRTFLSNNTFGPVESEYTDVGTPGCLAVPRLQLYDHLNQLIDSSQSAGRRRLQGANSAVYRLRQVEPGIGDVHREWAEKIDAPDELEESMIEVKVIRTVLGENDLEAAMVDDYPLGLGLDVLGEVTRIGGKVGGFVVGDIVIGIANGALQNKLVLHEGLAYRLPQGTRGSMPVSSRYMAAYHALGPVLEKKVQVPAMLGKILVHHAASSWGQAAVQMAKGYGFRVCALVQDEEQRFLVERSGADEVFLSGDKVQLDVMTFDAIFNPAEALPEALKTWLAYRSSDPKVNGPPMELSILFETVVRGLYIDKSIPVDGIRAIGRHSVSNIQTALETIRDRPFFGLQQIDLDPNTVIPVTASREACPLRDAIDPEGAYVLVGAYGGLGEKIADMLVYGGAKHLVFLSRKGEGTKEAKEFADGLRAKGVKVQTFKVDVCHIQQVKSAWRAVQEDATIVGVVQCAAVLKDSVFDNATFQGWQAVIRPKTLGSHNLVRTAVPSARGSNMRKPWFIFLSSATGVIGNRGQAAYAAANTYQDALAHNLVAHGIPAASLDFGPVLGAGMLARSNRTMDILRASGFFGIRQFDFQRVLTRTIRSLAAPSPTASRKTPTQLVIGIGTGGIIRQNRPADPYWSRHPHYRALNLIDQPYPDLTSTSDSLSTASEASEALVVALERCSSVQDAAEVISEALVVVLAKTVSTLPEDIDVQKSAASYGVDSLLARTLMNWVVQNVGVGVSVFEMTADVSIEGLVRDLAERVMKRAGEEKVGGSVGKSEE